MGQQSRTTQGSRNHFIAQEKPSLHWTLCSLEPNAELAVTRHGTIPNGDMYVTYADQVPPAHTAELETTVLPETQAPYHERKAMWNNYINGNAWVLPEQKNSSWFWRLCGY